MFVNIIKSYRDVVAICDEELLGKTFEEGSFQLHVKENFYKGESFSEEDTMEIMKKKFKDDATFNIVGEKSVAMALKLEIINKNDVRKISGVPFILILL